MKKTIKKKKIISRKKKTVKKTAKVVVSAVGKPIGAVTHFYGAIKVAIIKFKKPVKIGTELYFRGSTTDFKQKIVSMQFDHKPILIAKKVQEIGMKVGKKVREGDEIYLIND